MEPDGRSAMNLDCPKCGKPLVIESTEPLERDEQLAGSKCAACCVVLTEEDIGKAMKNALDAVFKK